MMCPIVFNVKISTGAKKDRNCHRVSNRYGEPVFAAFAFPGTVTAEDGYADVAANDCITIITEAAE